MKGFIKFSKCFHNPASNLTQPASSMIFMWIFKVFKVQTLDYRKIEYRYFVLMPLRSQRAPDSEDFTAHLLVLFASETGWSRRLKSWKQACQPIRVWPKKMEVSTRARIRQETMATQPSHLLQPVQANNSLLICYIKSFPSSGGY